MNFVWKTEMFDVNRCQSGEIGANRHEYFVSKHTTLCFLNKVFKQKNLTERFLDTRRLERHRSYAEKE
jgi:hypothetical protein